MSSLETSVITQLIATTIGGLIGYFSARRVSTLNSQHAARANLRKAFAPALAVLYLARKHKDSPADEVPPFDVDKSLKEALPPQAAEIEVFRFHIHKCRRKAYQEAWEKYRYEVWSYGFLSTEFRQDVQDPYKVFEDLIHDILKFAD